MGRKRKRRRKRVTRRARRDSDLGAFSKNIYRMNLAMVQTTASFGIASQLRGLIPP